jgi:hypothetical protein
MTISTKQVVIVLAIGLCCVALLVVFSRDPAVDLSVRYLAWKHGLVRMDLDRATEEMNLDVHRETLVIGKTRQQLNQQFGYTSSLEQATPYVRSCVFNSPDYKSEIVQLRRSNWVVVMRGGRAAQLKSVEGC